MQKVDELIKNHKALRKNRNIIGTINKNYYFTIVDELIEELEKRDKMINEAISIIEVNEIDGVLLNGYCTSETEERCKHPEEIGTCKSCIRECLEREVNKEN